MSEKLTKLVRREEPITYPEDVARLRDALEELGYTASDHDIEWAYGEYSEDRYCAGWHILPSDLTIEAKAIVSEYLTTDS